MTSPTAATTTAAKTWKFRAGLLVPLAVLIMLGVMVFNQWFAPPPPPGSLAAQAQIWRDATEASNPLLSRVQADVTSVGGYQHVAMNATVAGREPLTYDLMKNVYDALLASTQEEWKGETIVVAFHHAYSENVQPANMDVNKVFVGAGFPYRFGGQRRGVSWEATSLVIIPDPALGGFPGTPEANGALSRANPKPTRQTILGSSRMDTTLRSRHRIFNAR